MSNTVSVVISTREINDDYLNHVSKMFSHPKTEIIVYENNNEFGLAELYNRGLAEAKNDIVVFMHDDLILETKNISDKIIKLFNRNPEFGIIGVAGTTDLVNGKWWEIKKSMVGRVYHQADGKRWLSKFSNEAYPDKPKEVVTIDGLFFAVNRPKLKAIFNTSFEGFHFYEIPFCVDNFIQDVKIGVTTRISVTHKSIGETNQQWEDNKVLFEEIYNKTLPLKLTNNKSFVEKLNLDKYSIGVGIVTYNSPERLSQSAITVPSWIKNFVIVNDGTPYDESVYPSHATVINHEENKGVGQAKNTAMKYLLEQGCEHIFIMEDDTLIKNEEVFDKYIKTSVLTGIKHLNYALQGPANKVGAEGFENLDERASMEHLTEPNPRIVIPYPDGIEVALYPNSVGSFSYYQREVIEKIGFFDENYKNAWEHVDHTYAAYKQGFTTPHWWFADINRSWEYLTDIENNMSNSTIAKTEDWKSHYTKGLIYFKSKNKYFPTEIPDTSPEALNKIINHLYVMR